jgi:hypothetical protein
MEPLGQSTCEEMISGSTGCRCYELATPRVFSDRTIHVILEVINDDTAPLTSYKRGILNMANQSY